MPKQIILVRHAKSDWSMQNFSDFERRLNVRGQSNVAEMPFRPAIQALQPDLVLSSPAERAKQTALGFLKAWDAQAIDFKLEDRIYEASLATLWTIINELPDQYQRVALFGHNPGFTELASTLGNVQIDNLPTCGLMVFDFDETSWKAIVPQSGRLLFYDYPKS